MEESFRCTVRRGIGFDLVSASGHLVTATAPVLRRQLTKALAHRGRVVLDLSDTTLDSSAAVGVLPAALAQAGGWPQSRLVVLGAQGAMNTALHARRIHELVPTVDDLAEAVGALDDRPARVRRTTWLVGGPGLATEIGLFTGECLADWRVPPGPQETAVGCAAALADAVGSESTHDAVPQLTIEMGDAVVLALRAWTARPPPDNLADGWSVRRYSDGFTVYATVVVPDDRSDGGGLPDGGNPSAGGGLPDSAGLPDSGGPSDGGTGS